MAGNWTRFKNN